MARLPQPGGDQRSQQQFIIFEQFEKMNTKDQRLGLKENQLAWLENLQPIAPNNLQTVPAVAATALATLLETIKLMFYAGINGVDYFICFTTVGGAFFVNISTGAIGQFAPDGTFSSAPDVTTWQASRILINDTTAGYCSWDGTNFTKQGTLSPNITVLSGGQNYGTAPTVTINVNGTGSGATAVAVLQAGSVIAVNLTNPGANFSVTDLVAVSFSGGVGLGATLTANMSTSSLSGVNITNAGVWPAAGNPAAGTYSLVISGGGGVNAAATATIAYTPNGSVTTTNVTNAGSGYTSPPSITWDQVNHPISNAVAFPTFAAAMANINVASVTVTAGGSGYPINSTLNLVFKGGNAITTPIATIGTNASGVVVAPATFSNHGSYPILFKPTVSVAAGGGAAAAAHVWPFVPSGTTLAVFQGRVWLGGATNGGAAGTLLQWTGLGSLVTLATATVTGTGSTYTSATGVVVLKLNANQAASFSVDQVINVTALSGTGTNLQSLAGYQNVTAVSVANNTISYTATSGLGAITIGGGNVANVSAYGGVGYDDFRASAASGSLQITDADLVHQISALRSFNNYLFIVGDQSVKQIGNISVSGSTTLFTILTLSSDQGTLYPKSCLSYNRIFMFVAPEGVYGVFGSTVQKVSDDLDGIFSLVDFTQQPQSALLDLNGIHNAAWLLKYKDPAGTRTIMVMFDGRRWFVTAQGNSIAAFASVPLLSNGLNNIYGTLTGTDVTQFFAAVNTAVAWKAQTSLTPHGNAVQGKKIVRAGFTSSAAGAGTVNVELDADKATQALQFAISATTTLVGGTNDANNTPANVSGVNIGMTLTGTLANFTLVNMVIEFQDTSLWKGA